MLNAEAMTVKTHETSPPMKNGRSVRSVDDVRDSRAQTTQQINAKAAKLILQRDPTPIERPAVQVVQIGVINCPSGIWRAN